MSINIVMAASVCLGLRHGKNRAASQVYVDLKMRAFYFPRFWFSNIGVKFVI